MISSNSAPIYLPKKNGSNIPQKNLYKDFYSSFNHYKQILGATRMSINKSLDKQIVIFSYIRLLLSN